MFIDNEYESKKTIDLAKIAGYTQSNLRRGMSAYTIIKNSMKLATQLGVVGEAVPVFVAAACYYYATGAVGELAGLIDEAQTVEAGQLT